MHHDVAFLILLSAEHKFLGYWRYLNIVHIILSLKFWTSDEVKFCKITQIARKTSSYVLYKKAGPILIEMLDYILHTNNSVKYWVGASIFIFILPMELRLWYSKKQIKRMYDVMRMWSVFHWNRRYVHEIHVNGIRKTIRYWHAKTFNQLTEILSC